MSETPILSSASVSVAAVHAASVMLDRSAGVKKACRLIQEAARKGAKLLVFPESFIPGFPLWDAVFRPIETHSYFRRICENALMVPSGDLGAICRAAESERIFVSLGFTEVSKHSPGCLWNSTVLIGDDGRVLNHHRKLVPTYYEKLTWTGGDGAGLRVVSTPIGRIGSLTCGENNNPLSRYTLIAQGEQIHTASYPPVWPFDAPDNQNASYDLADAIRIRAAAHSFEGKVFTIVSAGYLDDDTVYAVSGGDSEAARILESSPRSCSMVVGPRGELLSDVLSDEEGIVYADINVGELLELKQHHDLAGYYNRFDIYELRVDRSAHRPIVFVGDVWAEQGVEPSQQPEEESRSAPEQGDYDIERGR